MYLLEKEEKEARKKQHTVHLKEIKLISKIEEHDYQTKLRSATRFLDRGDMVKLNMWFRGREMAHTDLGKKVLDRFIEDVSDVAEVEKYMGLDRRSIVVHLQSKAQLKKKRKSVTEDAKAQNK